jgi:DNA-binding transcriptional LysR family regulator
MIYKTAEQQMEMHQVRYFLAAARTLNFTKAAEESNVTQPSLTRAIQKLEEEFGGLLFRRERSLTHLTELGRQMVPHLERTYEAAQAAKMLAKGMGRAAVAPLKLGIAGNMPKELAASLAQVGEGLPGFQLSLVHLSGALLIEEMLHGEIDAAMMLRPRTLHDRFETIELTQTDYAIAVSSADPISTMVAPCIRDLADLSWIENDVDVSSEFREQCAQAGVELEFQHRCASDADALALVASGLGCTLVPASTALPAGVTRIDIPELAIQRSSVFATISGRQRSMAIDALIRAIKARSWGTRAS